jgi:hypothetical protein
MSWRICDAGKQDPAEEEEENVLRFVSTIVPRGRKQMKHVFVISKDNRGIEFLLRAFAELRKATISFVVFVCSSVLPSIRVEQLGSHWTDFH